MGSLTPFPRRPPAPRGQADQIGYGEVTAEVWAAHLKAQSEPDPGDPAQCERCRTAHRHHQLHEHRLAERAA